MTLKQRIEAFVSMGDKIRNFLNACNSFDKLSNIPEYQAFEQAITESYQKNGWFTRENVLLMFSEIAKQLTVQQLENWLKKYPIYENEDNPKNIALIMAGNIPLVGFHDLLCILILGHKALVKLSSDDEVLPKFFVHLLTNSCPSFKNYIKFTNEKLTDFDAVIATGSNNSARYFEYYFNKYPHIIRKNKNSAAILTGNESETELKNLGFDIFNYFGLGCRSVSKLYVPQNYSFSNFFKAIFPFNYVINNKKYGNNYDYNRAIYLLNKEPFLDNNFLILKSDTKLASPVGVLFYEEYTSDEDLTFKLRLIKDQLQCLVSNTPNALMEVVPFGQSQCPQLNNYADGIDTIKFILELEYNCINQKTN